MNRGYDEIPSPRRAHNLTLSNREKMTISGVSDVESFNELEVLLLTDVGSLSITGEGLHISKLNLDDGQLVLEGMINSVDYADAESMQPKTGIFSRLFR